MCVEIDALLLNFLVSPNHYSLSTYFISKFQVAYSEYHNHIFCCIRRIFISKFSTEILLQFHISSHWTRVPVRIQSAQSFSGQTPPMHSYIANLKMAAASHKRKWILQRIRNFPVLTLNLASNFAHLESQTSATFLHQWISVGILETPYTWTEIL